MEAKEIIQQYLRRLRPRRTILKSFALLWLASFVVLESFFFSEVLKAHNYLEVFPSEFILPTVMHAVTATLIAGVITAFKRPSLFGAKMVSAIVLAMFMVGYTDRLNSLAGFFRALVPILPKSNDLPVISLVLLVIVTALSLLIGRLVERWLTTKPTDVSRRLTVAGFIFLAVVGGGQAFRVAQLLPDMVRQSTVKPNPLPAPPNPQAAAEKPDIYYIVLDRYTSQSVLTSQFGFSNEEFLGYLRQNNFTVNDTAKSNYPYTAMSISSTINADYTSSYVAPFKNSDVQSRTLYHNLIRQASIIQALKKAGYEYHNIGSNYGSTNRAPLATQDYANEAQISVLGHFNKRLRGLEWTQFQQSPLYGFTKIVSFNKWPIKTLENGRVGYVRSQLDTLDSLASAKATTSRFIFAHILLPHPSYDFNSDGSLSPHSFTDDIGKTKAEKYLGQVQFINKQLANTIKTILTTTEGRAVVVVNSDEGEYPVFIHDTFRSPITSIPGDIRTWPDEWLQLKYGILQAVHIPAATTDDLANLSSVNIFRIILNRYLGYNLPYLPNCHYALIAGTEPHFNYADITQRLTGTDNPQCRQWESLPR